MEKDPTKSVPGDLPAHWRNRAAFLSNYGDPNSARLWQTAAAELDEALKVLGEQTLSLVEAAELCGYTADHLGTLVRKGKLPNAGRSDAPMPLHKDCDTIAPKVSYFDDPRAGLVVENKYGRWSIAVDEIARF